MCIICVQLLLFAKKTTLFVAINKTIHLTFSFIVKLVDKNIKNNKTRRSILGSDGMMTLIE